MDPLSRLRMMEGQPVGMECLTPQPFHTVSHLGVIDRSILPPPPVGLIPQERMPHRGEMNADLVGSARVRDDLEVSECVKLLKDSPSRHRFFSLSGSGRHPFALGRMPTDLCINDALSLSKSSMGDGPVDLFDIPTLELFRQVDVGHVVLGHHHHTRRIFVQPVDDARPQNTADSAQVSAVVEEGVHERSCRVARCGMDDHSSGFVYHNDGGVLEEDTEREGLGLHRKRLGLRDNPGEGVPPIETGARFGGFLVEEDETVLNELLGMGSRQIQVRLGEELVKPPSVAFF